MSIRFKFFYSSLTKSRLLMQLYILLFIAITAYCDEAPPFVLTKQGIVIGYYKTSYLSRKYAVYQGIPYAKAPVGHLRFEEPRPAADWGVLFATQTKSVCAQYVDAPLDENNEEVPVENRVEGKDDCLYLNINVPRIRNKKKKMPVVFMIHGGSFQYGSGGPFSDHNIYLPEKDMVFVTINYRVGIQGFLSTEDEVLPGNLGLKDQSMALKWTSENIDRFNGDPTKIIIIGFGAGSSSVQYHHLSPLSRGLFHASIAFSGTVFNPWGFARNAAEKAKQLGYMFDCPTNNSRKMIDCLKMVPAEDLAVASKEFHYWQFMSEAPFAPVVEKAGSRPFINKSPEEIVNANEFYSVPSIFGITSEEGCDPGAGVCHADDFLLVFDANKPYIKNTVEMDMINFLLSMLKNLINEGKPNLDVEWEPVDPKDSAIKYLHISNPHNYKMIKNSNFGNKKFWGKYFDLQV